MWQWLPLILTTLGGAASGGLGAYQASREARRQDQLSSMRRSELQPLIDDLLSPGDYFGMEENLVRNFTRAADQMAAQGASTGMMNAGSGGLDHQRRDTLGSMIAELSQFQAQDQLQRKQMAAQLLSDPSLYSTGADNVTGDTILGALGGALGGASSGISSYLSTPEGLAALQELFGGGSGPAGKPMGGPVAKAGAGKGGSGLPLLSSPGNVVPGASPSAQAVPIPEAFASLLRPTARPNAAPFSPTGTAVRGGGFGSYAAPGNIWNRNIFPVGPSTRAGYIF